MKNGVLTTKKVTFRKKNPKLSIGRANLAFMDTPVRGKTPKLTRMLKENRNCYWTK